MEPNWRESAMPPLSLIMLSSVNLAGTNVEFALEKILESTASHHGHGWMLSLKFRKEQVRTAQSVIEP